MKSKKIFVLVSSLALLLAACNKPASTSQSQSGSQSANPTTSETSNPTSQGGQTEVAVTALAINKATLSLEAGKSESLSVTVTPENASNTKVTWETSDAKVATVSSLGKVTAVKVGTATITAKSVSNPTVTATCAVTVTEEGGKYGSLNKPKTVAEALAIAAEECKDKDAFTAQSVYVTGFISRAVTNKSGYSLGIYLKDSLTDANAKEFLVYSADHDATLTPYQNDKIVVHGYIQNYNDQTIEMTTKDKEKPAIDKVERGTSSIAYSINDGQFNADAPKNAKNLAEVVLTITPASGKVVNSLLVNGNEVAAETDGSYKFRVTGNMTVVANIFDQGVTIVKSTMKYTGTETTNMAEGNNAALVNLDANIFNVESTKTTGPYAGLNKNGDIRLYNNRNKETVEERRNGTTVTVSSKRAQMKKVLITLAGTTTAAKRFGDMEVKAGDQVIAAGEVEGVYSFNSKVFSMQNINTDKESQQFHIASVEIFYVLEEKVAATGVTVTPATAEVQVDKDVQLEATLEPSNATDPIVWKSADETKAKVSQTGKVTGVAETDGVKITAFADANENGTLDAGEFKAEATIKVTAGDVINYGTKEAPLTVAQAKAVLDKTGTDESKQPLFVKGIISTNKDFSTQYHNGEVWLQSDDGSNAKELELWSCEIDASLNYSGDPKADDLKGYEVVVTGYGKIYGTTYELTNVTKDGARVNPKIISMTREEVVATEITVAPTSAEVEVGKTVDLAATVTPANSTQKVAWKSSDEAKATVANGKVRGVAEGNVTITAFVDADKDGVLDEGELKADAAITVKQGEVATEAVYSLKKLNGNNTNYASMFDVEFEDGKQWKIPGNQSLDNGLKIGGKPAANDETKSIVRNFYSKSNYASVSSFVITHGAKDSQITVNSLTLYVFDSAADAAGDDLTKASETVVGTFVDSGVSSFAPADGSKWENKYFKVVYNMTTTAASSNKGVMLTELKLVF